MNGRVVHSGYWGLVRGVLAAGVFVAASAAAIAAQAADAASPPTAPAPQEFDPGRDNPKPDAAWIASLRHRGQRKVYKGAELETIGMPCGGVAAGQLYVRGDGTLAQWWIFNKTPNTGYGDKCYRTYRPDSPLEQGFAIWVRPEGGKAELRRLSCNDFDAIEFIGEYPIAEIRYRTGTKPTMPVEVTAEVFSPFVPLSARDSAMPVTVLRYTVRNTGAAAADVTVAGWLQNGVLLDLAGRPDLRGRSAVVREDGLTAVRMDALEVPLEKPPEPPRTTVIEDFESGSYDGWTVTGDAFGPAPATGTFPRQQPVTGWQGKFFVNTYRPGDETQGTLLSRPFTITEPFIAFLIGGGSHKGQTCMNLIVDSKVVRSATGCDKEALSAQWWNVAEFRGKQARIEIVDRNTGPWGHINVDYICQTNAPPDAPDVPPREHPGYGDMAIAAIDGRASVVAAESAEALLADLADDGRLQPGSEQPYPLEARRCGAVASAARLAPQEQKTFTFLVTWCFPNRRNVGNMYGNWFGGAVDVARYVAANFDRLAGDTYLYRNTYFDTTLPYWLAARLAMPVSTLATETCQWWKNGRFYAWEGVGCCEGTCTHVWNYEHACARLLPELSRSQRLMQDLDVAFDQATGLVGFRGNRAYAADGQAGTILKVYREHLMSADRKFLDQAWPRTRKALEFLLQHDGNDDGLIEDVQHNTFDINFIGPNTFVGSLYLAALRAGEEMARLEGDAAFADRCRNVVQKGRAATLERLWNGEYFVQAIPPGQSDKHQYGQGCLSDQVFGQGWAHQVGLGYIYPRENVLSALGAVYRYNWTSDVGPLNRRWPPQRWFARPGEPGLFTCTWPRGGRPAEPVLYRDEVWTGIEYQVAGHMFYEGMIDEALAIIRGVHDRYDGARHNPWNEVECGDHYARAMASWGCLLALEGYVYDGPAGVIGFAPRLTPEDFKAFFTAAEGWGSLVQRHQGRTQVNRIEVRWGSLRVARLILETADASTGLKAQVLAAGRRTDAQVRQDGRSVRLDLAAPVRIERGQAIEATLSW